jgi:hypothetical protein
MSHAHEKAIREVMSELDKMLENRMGLSAKEAETDWALGAKGLPFPEDIVRSMFLRAWHVTEHKVFEICAQRWRGCVLRVEIEDHRGKVDHPGVRVALGLAGWLLELDFYDDRHYQDMLEWDEDILEHHTEAKKVAADILLQGKKETDHDGAGHHGCATRDKVVNPLC